MEEDVILINGKPATEAQRANLFKPGVSGNPSGVPKGTVSLTKMLKSKLSEVPVGQVKSYAEQLIEIILEKSVVEKDPKTLKMVMEYMEGMPRQRIGIEGGEEGSTLVISHEIADRAKDAIKKFLSPNEESDATGDTPK